MEQGDLSVVILTCRHDTVINEKVAWIPRRCLVCGEELDWENIIN